MYVWYLYVPVYVGNRYYQGSSINTVMMLEFLEMTDEFDWKAPPLVL